MPAPNLFTPYDPDTHSRPPPPDLEIRLATITDAPAIAAIAAERDGGDIAHHESRITHELESTLDRTMLCVAQTAGQVVAFARAGWHDGPTAPSDRSTITEPAATGGWFLLGITVTPPWRRRGIARALTAYRLHWLAQHTDAAYYFVNARNRASIDLHAKFGFEPIDENYQAKGVTFTGGRGILFRVSLARRAEREKSPSRT